MLLAVDIGNSNIVVGVFDGDELRASWRMATDVRRHAPASPELIAIKDANHDVAVPNIHRQKHALPPARNYIRSTVATPEATQRQCIAAPLSRLQRLAMR